MREKNTTGREQDSTVIKLRLRVARHLNPRNNLDGWNKVITLEETEKIDEKYKNFSKSERLVLENLSPLRTLAGRLIECQIFYWLKGS